MVVSCPGCSKDYVFSSMETRSKRLRCIICGMVFTITEGLEAKESRSERSRVVNATAPGHGISPAQAPAGQAAYPEPEPRPQTARNDRPQAAPACNTSEARKSVEQTVHIIKPRPLPPPPRPQTAQIIRPRQQSALRADANTLPREGRSPAEAATEGKHAGFHPADNRMKPAPKVAAINKATTPDKKKTPRVLVATENNFIIEATRVALGRSGIALEFAEDGRKAVEMAGGTRPDLLVLDAAIQGVFSFEVCDTLRKNGRLGAMRIILTSAVYNKNRYRRKPADLFGADEYMEAHCLERELPARAGALLGLEIASIPEAGPNGRAETGERDIAAACGGARDNEAKAKRLARVIASDIMLYYGGKLGRKAAVEDAFLVLKEEIEEGLRYFREKAPGSSDSYLHDALRERLDSAFAGTAKKLVAELKAMRKPAERT